jgi:hypothetical protein
MVHIFTRLRNNLLIILHVSTLMGHLQVFSVTRHLLLNYNARFIHFLFVFSRTKILFSFLFLSLAFYRLDVAILLYYVILFSSLHILILI